MDAFVMAIIYAIIAIVLAILVRVSNDNIVIFIEKMCKKVNIKFTHGSKLKKWLDKNISKEKTCADILFGVMAISFLIMPYFPKFAGLGFLVFFVMFVFLMMKEIDEFKLPSLICVIFFSVYVWFINIAFAAFSEPEIWMRIVLNMAITAYMLWKFKEKLSGHKYAISWLFMFFVSAGMVLYVCGLEILLLEQNEKALALITESMQIDMCDAILKILFTGIFYALNTSNFLPDGVSLLNWLENFNYDIVRSLMIWGIYASDFALFSFFKPDAPKYISNEINLINR